MARPSALLDLRPALCPCLLWEPKLSIPHVPPTSSTDRMEGAMKCLTGMVAVLVLCATQVANARDHGSKAQTQTVLHGPGSSHNPIVYHPVHGPGSSHNPIVRSPGKTVVRDHRKKPCYIRCHPEHRPDLTNAEGGRAVTTSRSTRYQGGDTSRDHRHTAKVRDHRSGSSQSGGWGGAKVRDHRKPIVELKGPF
jgi:hypothetical protein